MTRIVEEIAATAKQKCGRCRQWHPVSEFAWELKAERRRKFLCKPCNAYVNKPRINPDDCLKLNLTERWER